MQSMILVGAIHEFPLLKSFYSNPKSFVASTSLSQRGLMAERSRSLFQLISDYYIYIASVLDLSKKSTKN